MNLQKLGINSGRYIGAPGVIHPPVSMLSSPGGICLGSDSESRLGFIAPASTSPSGDKVNPADPDEDPSNRRTGASAEDDAVRLYVKIPMGWSNLQLGPNLQMP
ncbi:hypothetical protein OIU77_004467 [Salix suchowensis]|uniref:Uncharacterized protein n=1 Tax=Salix suchowensis TaxID=1278906 RepID=A0ABQ9AWC0_9ROSI|nr:hypothetical protein OIU77_004467 [Salix suchowensis]